MQNGQIALIVQEARDAVQRGGVANAPPEMKQLMLSVALLEQMDSLPERIAKAIAEHEASPKRPVRVVMDLAERAGPWATALTLIGMLLNGKI